MAYRMPLIVYLKLMPISFRQVPLSARALPWVRHPGRPLCRSRSCVLRRCCSSDLFSTNLWTSPPGRDEQDCRCPPSRAEHSFVPLSRVKTACLQSTESLYQNAAATAVIRLSAKNRSHLESTYSWSVVCSLNLFDRWTCMRIATLTSSSHCSSAIFLSFVSSI